MGRLLGSALAIALCAACGGAEAPAPQPVEDSTDALPGGANPCSLPEKWPFQTPSEGLPFLVHTREAADADQAARVVALLETAWTAEVDGLGFDAPISDAGACGPDERFDVFLWRGRDDAFVDILELGADQPYANAPTYMVVDAWGQYAGPILDTTMAHEFNHACQAADDWWDAPIIYEMTSTFIEDVIVDDDDEYMLLLHDFQSRPDWSIDRDDHYATWYMYAASLFLFYVRDRYYAGDAHFVAEMWQRMKNAPGADIHPAIDDPDFEDALDFLLQRDAGVGYLDAVADFARWRWYTGARDDGRHFEEGARFPANATVASSSIAAPTDGSVPLDPAPMKLGSAYLDVRAAPGTVDVGLALVTSASGVRWIAQAVPGLDPGEDGETIDLDAPAPRLRLAPDGTRTLVLTAMPDGAYDADTRTDERFPASVVLTP